MCPYSRFNLLYRRNSHSIVKHLYSNKEIFLMIPVNLFMKQKQTHGENKLEVTKGEGAEEGK